jgi:hypothetical protein
LPVWSAAIHRGFLSLFPLLSAQLAPRLPGVPKRRTPHTPKPKKAAMNRRTPKKSKTQAQRLL